MSKYTTEVRFICETAAGLSESTGYNSVNDIITQAIPKVFNFDFPIFDEAYRNVLLKKILKHYYTREISEETVGLWKLRMDTRLNEIMPYYNQLYRSELLEFNPLYDVDFTRTHEGSGTNNRTESSTKNIAEEHKTTIAEEGSKNETDNRNITSKNTVNSTNTTTGTNSTNESGNSLDKYSDTPQGNLDNVVNGSYLTNARDIDSERNISGETSETSTGNGVNDYTETNANTLNGTNNRKVSEGGTKGITENGNVNGSVNSTEEYLEKVSGKMGGTNYSEMLMKYRKTFLNIDMMVINELEDLFFGLW